MCKQYPVLAVQEISIGLVSQWKCCLLQHFYQTQLKANPPTPVSLHQPPACSCLNNEVTSPSWLQPRRNRSIVSITTRKNEGPLLTRRMWCPCPSNPHHMQHHFPPPAPCHTHTSPSTSPSLTVTVIQSEGKWNLWCRLTFPFTCCNKLSSYCLMLKRAALMHKLCTRNCEFC